MQMAASNKIHMWEAIYWLLGKDSNIKIKLIIR